MQVNMYQLKKYYFIFLKKQNKHCFKKKTLKKCQINFDEIKLS